MGQQFTIDPDAFLDDDAINKGLGVSYGALEAARRKGELRFARKGGKTLYLGAWVREWLTKDEPQRPLRRRGAAA